MKNLEQFLFDLAARESGGSYTMVNTLGYLGKYQMGEAALVDSGYYLRDGSAANDFQGSWTGKDGVDSKAAFLNSPVAQENAIRAYADKQWGYIRSYGLDTYVGQTLSDGTVVTESGLLAGAHLKGIGGLIRYIRSNGADDNADAYGTRISSYVRKFSGYDISQGAGAQLAAQITDFPDADIGLSSGTLVFANGATLSYGGDTRINVADDRRSTKVVQVLDAALGIQIEYRVDAYGQSLGGHLVVGVGDPSANVMYSFRDPSQIAVALGGGAFIVNDGTTGLYVNLASGDNLGNGNGGRINLYFDPATGQGNLYRQNPLTAGQTMEVLPAGSVYKMQADGSLLITKPDSSIVKISAPGIATPGGGSAVPGYTVVREIAPGLYLGKPSSGGGAQALYVDDTGDNNPVLAWIAPGSTIKAFRTNQSDKHDSVVLVTDPSSGSRTYFDLTTRTVGRFDIAGNGEFVLPDGTRRKVSGGEWFITPNGSAAIYNKDGSVSFLSKVGDKVSFDTYQGPETARLLASGSSQIGDGDNADGTPRATEVGEQSWSTGMTPLDFASAIGNQLASTLGEGGQAQVSATKSTLLQLTTSLGEPTGATILSNGTVLVTIADQHFALNGEAAVNFSLDEFNTLRLKVVLGPNAGQEAVLHNFSALASANPDFKVGGFIPTSAVLREADEAALTIDFANLQYSDDLLFSGEIRYSLDEDGYIEGNAVSNVAISVLDGGGNIVGTLFRDDESPDSYLLKTEIWGSLVEFGASLSDGVLTLEAFRSIDGQSPLFMDLVNASLRSGDINAKDLLLERGDVGNVRKLLDAANPNDGDGVTPLGSGTSGGPAWFASGDPRVLATEISSLTGLIAAIDSGNPLHIATNAFNVAASALPGEWAGDSAGTLNAITGLINFKNAVERGDMLAAVSGGGGVVLTAINVLHWAVGQQIVANWGNIETARVAVAAGDQSAIELVGQYDALEGAAAGLGEALPVIGAIAGVIGALDSEHPNYADAVMSVVALIPFYGPIIYAAYQAGKVMHAIVEKNWGGTAADILVGPDEPIKWFNDWLSMMFGTDLDIHAEGEFASDGNGGLTIKLTGQEDGGEKALEPVMQRFLDVLNEELQKNPSKGYVAQRMPKLSYRGYEDGGGEFTLSWVDQTTGELVSRTFDQTGLLRVGEFGDDQTIAAADQAVLQNGGELALSPAFHASLGQAFDLAVKQSGALASYGEARTADIQAGERWGYSPTGETVAIPPDPLAGLTTIARARAQGQLLASDPGDASTAGPNAQQSFRPIVLDFNGYGFVSGAVRRDQGLGVLFDVDDDGYAEQTDWIGTRASMLVIDRNGDGKITTGSEMFSDSIVDMSARGLDVLKALDANGDGKLTQFSDPMFSALRIWQDIDGDGLMEGQEGRRLGQDEITRPDIYSGVISIDLTDGSFVYAPELGADPADPLGPGGFDWDNLRTGRLNLADLQASSAGIISASNGNTVEVIKETGERLNLTRAVFDMVYAPQSVAFEHNSADGALRVFDQAMDGFEDHPLLVSKVQLLEQPSYDGELTFVGLGQAVGGTVAYNTANGVVTFTPSANYNGSASFEYTMADADGRQVTARALIALVPINDGPVVTVNAASRLALASDYQLTSYVGGEGSQYSTYALTDGATLGEMLAGSVAVATLDYTSLFGKLGYLGLYDGKLAWKTAGTTSWQSVIVGDSNQGSLTATDVETSSGNLKFELVADGRFGKSNFDESTGTWHYESAGMGGADDVFIVDVIDADGGRTRQRIVVMNPNIATPEWEAPGGGSGDGGADPVVLDLGGDGIQFISVRDSSAFFDFTGDGVRERAGWISGSDALLVYDANGDGQISGRSELVLRDLLPGAATDLEGLAALDANGDGMLSAADPQWLRLMGWQDRNEDGVQDPNELVPVAYRGIQSINLTSDGVTSSGAGATIHGFGTFTRIDGSVAQLADVSLQVSAEQFSVNPDDTVVASVQGGLVDTGTGDDRIHGGAGVDEVYAGSGNDQIAGGAGNDILSGNAGNDLIAGEDGNDELLGGFGNDSISGGSGNDKLSGNQGNDKLDGGDGADQLFGQSGSDHLSGGAGDDALSGGDGTDQLFGGSGNDALDGGAGGDRMRGELGNDVYRVDSRLDVVVEAPGEGNDTVVSTVDVEGIEFVENVVLAGDRSIEAVGTLGNDRLWGNQADNLLDAGIGADYMAGGAGDDTYVVDNSEDVVVELADGVPAPNNASALGADNAPTSGFFNAEGHAGFSGTAWGIDTVRSSVTWQLGANLENLTLTGAAGIDGTGNAQANVLIGNTAANKLAGRAGNDTLRGGAGFDTYAFDRNDGHDRIEDAADGGQISFGAGIAWSDLKLQAVGNDLVVDVMQAGQSTGDRITLTGWVTNAERIATVRLADGTTHALSLDTTPPPVNHAPTVAQPVADTSTKVGSAFELTLAAGTFVDSDAGDVLTLSARQANGQALPAWLSFDAGARRFSGTPPVTLAGSVLELAVTATDSAGAKVSDAFRVELQPAQPVNHAPVPVDDTTQATATAAATVSGNVLANDSDPDAADHLSVKNQGSIDGTHGKLQLAADGSYTYTVGEPSAALRSLAAGQQATDAFTITVGDDGATPQQATSTLTVRLIGVNDTPTVDAAIADTTAKVNKPFELLLPAGMFKDVDQGDTLTLSAHLADGSPLPDWLSFDAAAGRFSGTPAYALAGTALDLRITATDATGASVSDSFRLDLDATGLTLTGTADADELTGTEYNDTLIGNAGNDTVSGGAGFDTYRFARGDGADRLVDAAQGGRIVFGAGIVEADLRLTRDGDDAVIELLDAGVPAGDRITLVAWTPGSDRITRLEFSDSPALTLTQELFNRAPVLGDDSATGTEDVATLTGNVLANDSDPDAADILRVANAGVYARDSGKLELADGGTWVFTPSTAAQSLAAGQTVSEQFDIAVVDRVGGSAITRHSTLSITLTGSNDAPVLSGSLADTSAAIRRVMSIPLPADLFSDVDSGDTLTWSVRLAGGAALPAWMSVDPATRTLSGTPPDAALDSEWAIEVTVVDAAGSSASTQFKLAINAQGLTLTGTEGPDTLTGTDLNDTLIGLGGADILDGKEGQDQMSGGAGDDRYAVDHASDTVTEAADGGNDTVVATISALLGNHLENLTLVGPDSIDGTGNTLDNVLVGNAAANTLTGLAGNDVLAGGQGDDVLDGGEGNDLYLYHQGEGREVLRDSAGTDTLRFGAGITLDSVAAREQLDDSRNVVGVKLSLLRPDGSEDASQTIEWASGTTIERFEFVDGSVKTLADLLLGTKVTNGTNGNDTLYGSRHDDFLYGGNGNDSLRGYTGNDWLDGGNGADRLIADGGDDTLRGGNEADELWGGAGNDVLEGNNGVDQLAGGSGNDLLLGGNDADRLDGGDGNDLLDGLNGLDDLYAGAGSDTLDGGNDADVLAAGAGDDKITAGNGRDAVIAGAGNDDIQTGNDGDFVDAGAGNDTIASGNGVDFIAPGQGNDTIDAGADHDIIAFNRGDGADVINTSSWQRDTLSIGGGIRYADLRLKRAGNDLVVGLGNGDSVTLQGWYVDSSRRNVTTLQVVTGAVGGDYLASSSDRLLNRMVVSFNFESLVNRFDQWSSANPGQTEWEPAAELNAYYLAGSNTSAIGGNLAWRYATTGSYGDIDARGAIDRMASIGATNWQAFTTSTAVDPWTALQAGTLLLSDPTVGLPGPITPASPPSSNELFFAAINAGGHKPEWVGTTPTSVLP